MYMRTMEETGSGDAPRINTYEANRIQAEWMKLDSNGPKDEIARICKLYEKLPVSYIAVSDSGSAQVMHHGMPTSAHNCTIEEAIDRAKAYGIQTQLRWNIKGVWQ